MTFKPKQLDPEAVKTFSESEVGTLLENIDDKLDFLIEGQTGLVGRADRLDSGMTRLEMKVDTLTDTVGEMKVELTEVNEKLDYKVDRPQFNKLEKRVVLLEAK